MSGTVTVVGDGIVDIISTGSAPGAAHAGGAALNVAKGVAILGRPAALVFNSADDERGRWLTAHLRQHNVEPIGLPDPRGTGVARAHFRTSSSEPVYAFNDAVLHRRYRRFTDAAAEAIGQAAAVVLTAFPLDDAASVEAYVEISGDGSGYRVVDPNPRTNLLRSVSEYRVGFEKIAAISHLIKMSDEDIRLLYGDEDPVPSFTSRGAVVVITHGAAGATAYLPAGASVGVEAHELSSPIVDTLGAGDATLSTLVDEVLKSPSTQDRATWRVALERAMEIAAWTCRASGGTLRLPALTTKEAR